MLEPVDVAGNVFVSCFIPCYFVGPAPPVPGEKRVRVSALRGSRFPCSLEALNVVDDLFDKFTVFTVYNVSSVGGFSYLSRLFEFFRHSV